MVKNISCPQCAKKFATPAAMALHRSMKHANPKPANPPPKARRARKRPQAKAAISGTADSGTGLLTHIDVSSTSKVGDPLYSLDVSPRGFSDRVAAISRNWGRWKPTNVSFHLQTNAPSISGGSVVMAWSPSTGLQSLEDAMASHHVSIPLSFSGIKTLKTNRPPSQQWLQFDTEEEFHGTLHVILDSPLVGVSGTIRMTLTVSWSVLFDGPQTPTSDGLYANDAWTPYFSDSVSDWGGGKYLTLKHKEGGSVVPFPGLSLDHLYKVDGPGIPIYWSSGGSAPQESHFHFGAAIGGQYPTGLAIFKTIEGAKTFIKDRKDLSHCTEYVKAGSLVEPVNPAWRSIEKVITTDVESMASALSEAHARISALEKVVGQLAAKSGLGAGSSS